MRPIGGWLMGLYADRKGRKAALMASVLLMCFGSLVIALSPGYETIGVWAPVLLVLLMRISKSRFARTLARGYIELFQGTPLLMQLFLIFFGIALLGIDISPWMAAALALTLFTSAYLAEIWRGSVESIANGQWEASASLALSPLEQLRYVILPQALRVAIAPTVGFSVQVIKGTAVTSIIGFTELTKTGSMLANATFEPFMVAVVFMQGGNSKQRHAVSFPDSAH